MDETSTVCIAAQLTRTAKALAVLLTAACGDSAAAHLQRGDSAFQQSAFEEAIGEYERAEQLEPTNPHAIRQLGFVYRASGDRARAIRYLERWRTLSIRDSSARLALGELYLADGRAADAAKEASAILAEWPTHAGALQLAGVAELDLQNPEQALERFRRLRSLTPTDPRAPYLQGLGLLTQGRTSEATQLFEAALALDAAFLDPLTKLVEIELAQRRADAALARVTKQLILVPDSSRVVELLGLVHLARHDATSAETAFRRAMTLDSKYLDPYVRLSELYRSTGRLDDALVLVDRALALDPNNLSVRLVQGVTYENKGDPVRAARAYEDALKLNPKFAAAANNLATLLVNNVRELGRALEMATLARNLEPNNPAIADTYGWVLFRRGEYAQSVKALSSAAAQLPTEPTVAYHLGMAQAKFGDTTAARATLRRAVASTTVFADREAARQALALLR